MLPIVISPQADADIDTFFFHIAEDDVSVADSFLDKVEETLLLISEFPKLAPRFISEHHQLSGIRWFPIKNFPKHLVFYSEDNTQITVVRMLHKAQNISGAFE